MLKAFEQWQLFLTIGIVFSVVVQAGFVSGWSSPVLARLQGPNSSIPVTSDEGSWITSALAIASVFSTPLPALTMHYFGRKTTIIISVIPFLIFWFMVSVATSTTELIVARSFSGIGCAFIFTNIPVYLGEISPDNIRGGIGIGINVASNIGCLWIYWIGTYPELWISSISCAAPLLIVLGLYNFILESPYYLMVNFRRDEAQIALRKLQNTDNIDEELDKIESTINTNSTGNSIKELFTESSHRRALLISIGTFTVSQLTGGPTFLFYAHLIFEKAGNVSANTMALVKAASQLVTSIVAAYVVDNIGRKPLLIVSCIGSSISMFCEGIYFYLLDNHYNVDNIWWLPLMSMIFFNIFQVIGLSSISMAYLGELFHPKVKPVAVCVSKAYLSLMVSIVGKMYQVIADALGNCVPFFAFACMGVLGVFFVVFCVPETKGKSLEEIQYYMKHKMYREKTEREKTEQEMKL